MRDNLIHLSNVYISLRQASEWGMRGLQGTFILVTNFRMELVGHSQISEVFGPEYERVLNINGYDRIRQYYLQPGDYETDDEAELMEENFGNEAEDNHF